MQNGAPPHYRCNKLVQDIFQANGWAEGSYEPAQSQDLTPCVFLVQVWAKEEV